MAEWQLTLVLGQLSGGSTKLGMVVAAGPGIYVPEENPDVRIEDDVLFTGSGL